MADKNDKSENMGPSEFELDLAERQQEEELKRQQRLEQQRAQLEEEQIIAQTLEQEQQSGKSNPATDAIKDFVKDELKNLAKQGTKFAAKRAAQTTIGSAIISTAPVWGTILGVIVGLILLLLIIIGTFAYTCNQEGVTGTAARGSSTLLNFVHKITFGYAGASVDICAMLSMGDKTFSVPEPASAANQPVNSNMVPITGIPTEGTSNWQLRPCMLARVDNLYRSAQAQGISFVITSAFRPGAIVAGTGKQSAHARGEAVDIAIRPPNPPYNLAQYLADPNFQKKISTLVRLSVNEGFRPPVGDTLDEYNKPTEGATGGHIHIEFNLSSNGGSYCDVNP